MAFSPQFYFCNSFCTPLFTSVALRILAVGGSWQLGAFGASALPVSIYNFLFFLSATGRVGTCMLSVIVIGF